MNPKKIQLLPQSLVVRTISYLLLLFVIGCQNQKENGLIYDKDGRLIEINLYSKDSSLRTKIAITNGAIKYIKTDNDIDGQTVWMQNNGKIDQIFNFHRNIKNGHFYSFYESAALKEHRFLRNGKEVLFGADYWDDSTSVIKSSIHFNDNGEIFYKKNFDKQGNLINEEGKKN